MNTVDHFFSLNSDERTQMLQSIGLSLSGNNRGTTTWALKIIGAVGVLVQAHDPQHRQHIWDEYIAPAINKDDEPREVVKTVTGMALVFHRIDVVAELFERIKNKPLGILQRMIFDIFDVVERYPTPHFSTAQVYKIFSDLPERVHHSMLERWVSTAVINVQNNRPHNPHSAEHIWALVQSHGPSSTEFLSKFVFEKIHALASILSLEPQFVESVCKAIDFEQMLRLGAAPYEGHWGQSIWERFLDEGDWCGQDNALETQSYPRDPRSYASWVSRMDIVVELFEKVGRPIVFPPYPGISVMLHNHNGARGGVFEQRWLAQQLNAAVKHLGQHHTTKKM